MAATTSTINERISQVISRSNGAVKSVPEAAEHLGVPRATLYGVLRAEREGKLDDAAVAEQVAEVTAALQASEDEAGDAPGTDGAGNDGTDETTNQEANVAAGKKAVAKGAAKKAAAKAPAKAAAKKAAAPKAAGVEKALQLPAAGETIATTGAKVKVIALDGSESNRTVGPVKANAAGNGYEARVRIDNRIFEVTGNAKGTEWKVQGERAPTAERKAAAKTPAKAAAKAPAKAAAKTSEVRAAPKPSSKKKGK